jgi:hypothetical protein
MKRLLPLILLPLVLITGCGGGGGGSSTFTVKTDWTNAAAIGGGTSERIQLYDPTGALVQSLVVNQATPPSQSPFTGLHGGTYHLSIQLFSLTNVGGTEVGDLDLGFDPSVSKALTVEVGATPAKLVVSPNGASLPIQNTAQFYATAYAADGSATFVAPGSLAWSVLNSVGTVDPAAGLFTATTAGTGSVQATYTPLSLLAAGTVTVTPISTVHGTWTIMVFMNAANDLSQYSLLNFTQLQQATVNGNKVRTVVQWKQVPSLPYPAQFNGTRRYLVQQSTSSGIASQLVQDLGSGVDMGSYTTLNGFINWAKTYYPADHYALIVWDHGAGWQRGVAKNTTRAVSFDDEFGTTIQTWQLSQAIGANHIDILAWDASLMQMAEVADDIRSQVDYIAGSEESPPGTGYFYNLILNEFNANPTASPRTLSKAFVDSMVNGYASDSAEKITQSVIDTSQLPAVMTSIKTLGLALDSNLTAATTAIQFARNNGQSYSLIQGSRYYFDLYNLTTQLDSSLASQNLSLPSVTSANAAVRTALGNAVVWEGHNVLSPGSHGLAIDFSPASTFVSYATDYAQLRMAADTGWNTFLNQAP